MTNPQESVAALLDRSVDAMIHDWLHGERRHKQGYTVPMIVEESRILELSVFGMLEKHSASVDFSQLLRDAITVADEEGSQLKQTILGYMEVGLKPLFLGHYCGVWLKARDRPPEGRHE